MTRERPTEDAKLDPILIAIIADIHGNLQALNAVLEDAAKQGATRIIVNGDMVNRGPNGAAVLERIWDLGLEATLGNHDDLLRMWVDKDETLPPEWFTSPFWLATAWAAEQIESHGLMNRIRGLPMMLKLELPSAPSILIAHGSPRHYREGLSEWLTDESLSEILQRNPTDVLVGSHTHQPMERSWGQHRIFNTGAVGAPFNGDVRAQYLLLRLESGVWTPEFRRVSYDLEAALKAFETSGLLTEGGLSAELFYLELKYARSYLTPFWMWAEENNLEQTPQTWAEFKRQFPERFTVKTAPD